MKLKNKLFQLIVLTSCIFATSCNQNHESSLYVNKVENMKSDFIKGVDVSEVISLENSGVKYYNFNGKEEDVLKILSDNGINYIRVRVWNNPFDYDGNGYGGGNCTIDTALALGKRATKYNMKLLVDFHYSDFWADPSKQMCPLSWVGLNIEDKAAALYDYTKESLQKLKDNDVDVGMVQIGNEINNGLAGETTWFNRAMLLIQGSKATREVFPEAKIAVHFTNPEKGNYDTYAKKLAYYELDYDIFASSYYPFWHGTLENLQARLDSISDNYDKDVMVVETTYPFTTEDSDFYGNVIGEGGSENKTFPYTVQGQSNQIVSVAQAVANMKRGLGLFYWAGCWISVGQSSYDANLALWEKYGSGWASSYSAFYDPKDAGANYGGCSYDNQALFDSTGHPLESLQTWALMDKGNVKNVIVDAIEDTNLIIDLNQEIVLPTTVNAIMSDGSKQELEVTWENYDINQMKTGGVAKYTIKGTAGGFTCYCYISMVEKNYLTNYSFEDSKLTSKNTETGRTIASDEDLNGWTVNDISKKNEELNIEDNKQNSLTGTKHFHFWSTNADCIKFNLEQKVENLSSGKYKFGISIMGGDCSQQEIYLYVKINDEIVTKKNLTITKYSSWDSQMSDPFNYTSGDEIVVGIYVNVPTAKGWGHIDDGLLNSVA